MIKVYYCERTPKGDGKTERISQHRLAYSLLEQVLGENWPDLKGSGLIYDRNRDGKPFLRGYPQIHFNLSHCSCCVACALGDHPVGVDVEHRFPWKDSLARRICHPRELQRLEKLEDEERNRWLNRIWSRKESYLKYLGTGIRRDLRELLIWDGETAETARDGQKLILDGVPCSIQEVQTEGYTLVTCGREPFAGEPLECRV